MADDIPDGFMKVPVEFWRAMSIEEFLELCEHGATEAQIRRLYELSGLAPEGKK